VKKRLPEKFQQTLYDKSPIEIRFEMPAAGDGPMFADNSNLTLGVNFLAGGASCHRSF
jgi:hypothetical protein